MEKRRKTHDANAPRLARALMELGSKIGDSLGRSGERATEVPGLMLYRCTARTAPSPCTYEPSLLLIAQGKKRVDLGRTNYVFGQSRFLLTFSCGVLPATRSIRLVCLHLTHMHRQQLNRLSAPLTQQLLAIVPPSAKYLVGGYSGCKVCSTIRHFSPTGHRRLRGTLLTTARSEVSIYSPSGHSRGCPQWAIFRTYPHFV